MARILRGVFFFRIGPILRASPIDSVQSLRTALCGSDPLCTRVA